MTPTLYPLGCIALPAIALFFCAPSAKAALVTVTLNQVVSSGGGTFTQQFTINGAAGQSVAYASTPSLFLTWDSVAGAGAYYNGVALSNGPEAFVQASDGAVSFPTVVLTDLGRLNFAGQMWAGALPGTNFVAMKTSDNKYGWLSVDVSGPTSSSLTLNSFVYDDTATSAATAPRLVNGVVVVPEPSAALLGAVGAIGLLRRRR